MIIVTPEDVDDMQAALQNVLDTQVLDDNATSNIKNVISGLGFVKIHLQRMHYAFAALALLGEAIEESKEYINNIES